MSLHLDLAQRINEHFGAHLEQDVEVKLDALIVRLDNGVVAELRVASPTAYAFAWIWGDVELRIDTAPVHPGLTSAPNHLHTVNGTVSADPVTSCGAEPWVNVQALLATLLENPLLDGALS